jgi:hypothetical protein
MTPDATYFARPELAPARHLQRAGQWTTALGFVPDTPLGQLLRADILVDRHFWQLDPVEEAQAAVDSIQATYPAHAAFLAAQLEYWRQLQRPDAPPIADDPVDTLGKLAADAADRGTAVGHDNSTSHTSAHTPGFGGWAVFWHAVTLDLLRQDTDAAAEGYARALTIASTSGDQLLESYAIRHQGSHAHDAGDLARAIPLLERSLQLRAARGARPHTAAAQAALADALGNDPRANDLRAIVATTANELNLTWLKR